MKKLLSFLTCFFIAGSAQAQWQITVNEATAGEAEVPFFLFDATDGETPEPGLTISGSDCLISENGGAFGNCAGTVTAVANGMYVYAPAAAELDTRGHYVMIVEESGTTDKAYVAYQIRPGLEGVDFAPDGVTTSESGTTIGLASGAVDADDQFTEGFSLYIYNSSGPVGSACVVDSTNAGDTVVLGVDLSSVHTIGDSYILRPDALCRMMSQITTVATMAQSFTGQDLIQVISQFYRAKFEQTNAEQVWYRADGSTKWGEKDAADDGTTFSKDAFEAAD